MEGRDSDIIVSALSRDWKLHKLYLCQSPYFSSMFNGNWRESNMDHIDITIVDPNISLDSMNVTLGKSFSRTLFLLSLRGHAARILTICYILFVDI